MIFLHQGNLRATYVLRQWMAIPFACKSLFCLSLRPSTGKFTPQKATPIVPRRPHPVLVRPGVVKREIARWLACFCHCNEAKPGPEVSLSSTIPRDALQTEASPSEMFPNPPPPTLNHTLLFLWVPERGRESITPIRCSVWNCKGTVETVVFCRGQKVSLLGNQPHRILILALCDGQATVTC